MHRLNIRIYWAIIDAWNKLKSSDIAKIRIKHVIKISIAPT